MAQGKIYGQSGGETKSFAVTFTTIPDNCTVVVKDANQKFIN